MATFNRIVTTLLLLVLIPTITVGLVAPQEAIQLLRDALDQIDSQLDPTPSTAQTAILVLLALVIDVLLVILIYLEVRRPAETSVPVQRAEGGEAQIAINSVVTRLGYQVDRLPGVLDVKPTVIPRRGGVEVVLDVEMAADGNLSANIEEISAVTRRVIEEEMGLRLKGKPKLNLRTVDYPGPLPAVEPQLAVLPAVDETPDENWPRDRADDDSDKTETEDKLTPGAVDEPGNADSAS